MSVSMMTVLPRSSLVTSLACLTLEWLLMVTHVVWSLTLLLLTVIKLTLWTRECLEEKACTMIFPQIIAKSYTHVIVQLLLFADSHSLQ